MTGFQVQHIGSFSGVRSPWIPHIDRRRILCTCTFSSSPFHIRDTRNLLPWEVARRVTLRYLFLEFQDLQCFHGVLMLQAAIAVRPVALLRMFTIPFSDDRPASGNSDLSEHGFAVVDVVPTSTLPR